MKSDILGFLLTSFRSLKNEGISSFALAGLAPCLEHRASE